MSRYNDLCEILEHDLMELTKDGNINASNFEAVYKLLDMIKDIKKIQMMNEETESYAPRSGMHYVRGHYSRGRKRYDDGMRYSYADGIEHIIEQMEDMIEDGSTSEAEKNMIRNAMNMLNH